MIDRDRIAKARKSLAWLRDTDDTTRDSRAFADRQAAYDDISAALSTPGEYEVVAWWNQWGNYRELWTDRARADIQIAHWRDSVGQERVLDPRPISQHPLYRRREAGDGE